MVTHNLNKTQVIRFRHSNKTIKENVLILESNVICVAAFQDGVLFINYQFICLDAAASKIALMPSGMLCKEGKTELTNHTQ